MILLVNIIIPVVILMSYKEIGQQLVKKDQPTNQKIKVYISLILLVNLFSLLVFFVTDLLLFYISFEAI